MSELKREMPLFGQSIEHSKILIKPMQTGIVLLQQSECVAKMPLELPDFNKLEYGESRTIVSALPKQWLCFCELENTKQVADDYARQAGEQNIVISDMTDQYTVLSITGSHAKALLAKGCELDLSVDVFKPNLCARSLLASFNVVIWRGSDVLVDVSYAEHLWIWLQGASAEFTG
jgi:sarcosine oxidase subunit gamma